MARVNLGWFELAQYRCLGSVSAGTTVREEDNLPSKPASSLGRYRSPRNSSKLAAPTQAQWADKYAEGQATATRATKLELAGSYDEAFTAYITAAQCYLFCIRHTTDEASKTRLRGVSGKLVERAERIKKARKAQMAPVQRDRLALEEQDAVLQRSGLANGVTLPRWRAGDEAGPPATTPVEQPPLSPAQLAASATWISARQVFPTAELYSSDARGSDIVQDNVSDCSVVAALIIAAEHHGRFGSRLAMNALFPQDSDGFPRASPPGLYNVRLLFNGAWRTIDDKLPVSASGTPLCASTEHHSQLWPSLLEKAYLRLMGGYDFVGSNSANDLYTFSGWLPESIALRTGFRREQAWQRISKGVHFGKCVLTLGTGRTADSALSSAGLVPSHNYAVVALREEDGRRELILVNPWRTTASTEASSWTTGLREALDGVDSEDFPGALVVDWDFVSSHFASIHANWDPTVFDHSSTVHISVPSSAVTAATSTHRHNTRLRVQLTASPRVPSEVWLLLARHSSSPLEKNEFVGLSVSNSTAEQCGGSTQLKLNDATSMSDNLYLLHRFIPEAGVSTYDLDVSHEGPSSSFSFSLSAYSNTALTLLDGPPPLPYSVTLQGSWTPSTGGGNHTCSTFLNNPQYCVKLSTPAGRLVGGGAKGEINVVAETGKDSPVNVKLLHAGGRRVGDFEDRDVIAGRSTYNYGHDSLRCSSVSPGLYTLVASSFLPSHRAAFTLTLRSSLPLEVTPIPAEGAGSYARSVKGSWSPGLDGGKDEVMRNPRFRVRSEKATNVRLRLVLPSDPKPIALFFYTSTASGEPDRLLYSTLPYRDPVCGVVLENVRLEVREHGYVVVPCTYSPGIRDSFQILLFADAPVSFP